MTALVPNFVPTRDTETAEKTQSHTELGSGWPAKCHHLTAVFSDATDRTGQRKFRGTYEDEGRVGAFKPVLGITRSGWVLREAAGDYAAQPFRLLQLHCKLVSRLSDSAIQCVHRR